MMFKEDLGLNLNLQFGLVDHLPQDILVGPADNKSEYVLF